MIRVLYGQWALHFIILNFIVVNSERDICFFKQRLDRPMKMLWALQFNIRRRPKQGLELFWYTCEMGLLGSKV